MTLIKVLVVTAAPKTADAYEWFTYTGKRFVSVAGRKPLTVTNGGVFGVRFSADRKSLRLVMQGQETKVYTLDTETAKALAKNCVPLKKAKKPQQKGPVTTTGSKTFKGFDSNKMHAVVKPFWDKKGIRTTNVIGYHGTDEVTASKLLKSGGFKANSYFTSNPMDAMFWALMAADKKGVGASVIQVDLSDAKLFPGDQADNQNHCLVKKPVKASKVAYHEPADAVSDYVNLM